MPIPTLDTLRTLFPVGPYTLKIHGDQFNTVCGAIDLLEGLLTASEDSVSVQNFNAVITAATENATRRGASKPDLPPLPEDAPAELRELLAKLAEHPQMTREDMALAQSTLSAENLRRFVTVDFFTDIGSTFQRAFGPAGMALGQLGGPNIIAGAAVVAIARTLPHYVVNKDLMDANPSVDFNPNIHVKWSINIKARAVEIKGYYAEDDAAEADASEG